MLLHLNCFNIYYIYAVVSTENLICQQCLDNTVQAFCKVAIQDSNVVLQRLLLVLPMLTFTSAYH